MDRFARYEKQVLFAPCGLEGQKRLAKAKIGVLGVGALGTNIANLLARSGVGHLVLVDSDRIELSNLQRQMLFTESDIGSTKASTAANRLSAINSDITLEAFNVRSDEKNFCSLFSGCNLIMDATDNYSSRFLLNRMALKNGIPWIHTGVTGSSGQSIMIQPWKTACFACLIPEEEVPDDLPSVHNSGIINMIVTMMASISSATAIKYLIQKESDCSLKFCDLWNNIMRHTTVDRNPHCSHCQTKL